MSAAYLMCYVAVEMRSRNAVEMKPNTTSRN